MKKMSGKHCNYISAISSAIAMLTSVLNVFIHWNSDKLFICAIFLIMSGLSAYLFVSARIRIREER